MERRESFSEQEAYEKNCQNVQEYVQVESSENSEEPGHAMLYIQDPSMEGAHGEQHYVTIVQDGQTYAIPAADYEAMTARQAMQGDHEQDVTEQEIQHTVEETEEEAHTMESVETGTNHPEQMEVSESFSEQMVVTTNPNDERMHAHAATKPTQHMQVGTNPTEHSEILENIAHGTRVAISPTEHMQVMTNTSQHMQVMKNNSDHMQVVANTPEHMQVMSNSLEHTETVANTTEAIQMEISPSVHKQGFPFQQKQMQVVTTVDKHIQEKRVEFAQIVTSPNKHIQGLSTPTAPLKVVRHLPKNLQRIENPTEHMQVVTTHTAPVKRVTYLPKNVQMIENPTEHMKRVATPTGPLKRVTNLPKNIQMVTNPIEQSNQQIIVRTNPSEHVQQKVSVPTVSSDFGKKAAMELQKQNLNAIRKLNMTGESKILQRPAQNKQADLLPVKKIYNESQNVHKNQNQPEVLQSKNETPISYKRKLIEMPEYGTSTVQNNVIQAPVTKTSENISHPNERQSNVSMKWMTGGTSKVPDKPIPPRVEVEQPAKPDLVETEEKKKSFKPIRVDNWGIFLLSRLQAYFHKKEFCDLTLRFPSKNAQIKVHKLVINACTDFFIAAEKDGKVIDGCIDMPSTFTPETVAPIIRFMYTGKLEIKDGIFAKLHDAANSLEMSVLTKLMDAQLMAPSEPEDPNRRRKRKRFDDPVQQIRKIKKIERRVMNDELRAKRQARLDQLAKIKTEEDNMERTKLPGKKLPIWKKRFTTTDTEMRNPKPVISAPAPLNAPAYPYKIPKNLHLEPENSTKSPEKINSSVSGSIVPRPIIQSKPVYLQSEPVGDLKVKQDTSFRKGAVSTTYGKSRPTNGPKFPRKLQEIQQHLMFEKIMKTGTKNNIVVKDIEEPEDKQLSVEEIKELMIEQKQRTALGEDLNDYEDDYDNYELDDDYIDDEDMDEYQEDNGKESVITQINETKQVENPKLIPETPPRIIAEKSINLESHDQSEKQLSKHLTERVDSSPSKPILKHTNLMETPQPEAPRKSVRFSLRAGPENVKAVTLDSKMETIEIMKAKIESEIQNETPTAPVKRMSTLPKNIQMVENPTEHIQGKVFSKKSFAMQDKEQKQFELDVALEEFSRVAEEEEKELELANLNPENDASNAKQNLVLKKRGRPPKSKMAESKDQTEQTTVNVQEQVVIGNKSVNPNNDQANVISEVLKKYPSLFKDNKHVKIKVLTKDPLTGKESMQYITLKTQPDQLKTESTESSFLQSLKSVPKVMYTGKRGRPKKIKPGEHDPHAAERQQIEDRMVSTYSGMVPGPSGVLEEAVESDDYPGLPNFSQVEPGVQPSGAATPHLDPSSEAEAFSTVASGIAASLGLVEQQQQMQQHHIQPNTDSGLDYQHGDPQEVLVDQGQIQIVTTTASDDQLQLVSGVPGQRIHYVTNPQHLQFINTGGQAAWVPVMDGQSQGEGQDIKDEKRKVVVQIADDWDTEEDE